MSLWRHIRFFLNWLAQDADQMWADATLAEIYAENQRRHQAGRDPLR